MSLRAFKIVDDDFCEECGEPLADGDVAYADSETGNIYCTACIEGD